MREAGRALPASLGGGVLGGGVLVVVIALLGLGGALLAGRAMAPPAFAKGAAPEITFSVPPAVWALLFLMPLLVGFVAYLFRFVLDSTAGRPVRAGAGVAIAVVAVLLLFVLLPQAAWNANSTVTVGSAGVTSGGNGSSPGSSGSNGLNGTSGNGSGGDGGGSGASGTGGNSSGIGWLRWIRERGRWLRRERLGRVRRIRERLLGFRRFRHRRLFRRWGDLFRGGSR